VSDLGGTLPPDPAADDAYALFQRGIALLEQDHWAQAAVALEKAKRLEPDKASIREALGIAYFRIQH
jgi:Flp pilus assembly protein TadD